MPRVGLVGCGFIGRVHAWALWALHEAGRAGGMRVVATHDCLPERAAELAEIHDATPYDDADRLLDDVDAVYVCTPTAEHRALVEAAADRGVAIFCEKPLAPTLADAEAVAQALRRVPHQVGLVLRHAPVFRRLSEILTSGRYGQIMSIIFRDDQYFPNQGQYASRWREDVRIAGGGTLIEHSIHDLDILRWLAGDARVAAAQTASFAGHPGIEDAATLVLAHQDGATSTLVSIWHEVLSRPSTRRLEVFCTDALLWCDDDNTGPIHIETSGGTEIVECPPPGWVDALDVPEPLRRPLGLYAAADEAFLSRLGDLSAPEGAGCTEALAAHRLVSEAYTLASTRPSEIAG